MQKKMRNHRVSPEYIRRVLVYSILILLLATAQCSFFARLSVCPATPDLMLGLVAAVAMLDSKEAAMICGIGCGVLIDTLGSVYAISPLFYLFAALILGSIAKKLLPQFLSWLALLLPALVLRAGYTFFNTVLTLRALPSFRTLLPILGKESVVTFLLCIPLFFLIKFAVKIIGTRKHFDL